MFRKDSQKPKTGIKLLVTSRLNGDTTIGFGRYDHLEIYVDEEDVKIVLEGLLQGLPSPIKTDNELRRRVRDTIAGQVNGMYVSIGTDREIILYLTIPSFLLVELFVDSLRCARTRGDVNDALLTLTESSDKVSTVYDQALQRIENQESQDREIAFRILSWVACAKSPLTCRQFRHAMAVRNGSSTFQRQYLYNEIGSIVSLCAGLVVVNRANKMVQLIHYTATKYLKDLRHRPG